MHPRHGTGFSLLLSCALLFSSLSPAAFGQANRVGQPDTPQDEVLRISTSLVQTDVIVLDRQGRAVKDLNSDQFELLVDGQPQAISAFERVEAGSIREAMQLAATRGDAPNSAASLAGLTPGRSFIFFVDDMHLAPEGIKRTRDLLSNFVERMGEDDQALIVSPSGQIGFLQQLTDNKTALRLAVSRINYQAQSVPSGGRRAMTVYEALAIDRGQRSVLDYKTKEFMDDMGLVRTGSEPPGLGAQPTPTPTQSAPPGQGGNRPVTLEQPKTLGATNMDDRRMTAEMAVKNEARRILQHSNAVGEAVLGSLEFAARGSASLPGRKLFFFISDGFVMDTRSGQTSERLNRVIDTAARSGVAIYTVDSKGLTASNVSAAQDTFSDISGAGLTSGADATSIALSDDAATKEILRTLAADTGGRAVLNRNDLESGINQIVKETESYYVLAWRPQTIESSKPKFNTLKVSVKGRPDLRVLARKGYYTTQPPPLAVNNRNAPKEDKTPPAKVSETELRAAVSGAFPRRQLGLAAYTTYANESGDTYKIITFADLFGYQLSSGSGGKAAGEVDFAVVVLNDAGKSVSVAGQKVQIAESGAQPFRVVATLPNALPPGLYQVRAAARDAHTGRIGSSFQWLEIPRLKAGELALSNILLAEVTGKAGESLTLDVERRFARTSGMLIQMFIYNAARPAGGGSPDVAVTLQVLQNGQMLIAAPPQPISTAGVADQSRLQYGSEIPLSGFAPGRYALKILVEDRVSRTTASQQINFTIE